MDWSVVFLLIFILDFGDLSLPIPDKPGCCPQPSYGPCVTQCFTDDACRGNMKCCFNGCGRTCMPPVLPATRPGTCPRDTCDGCALTRFCDRGMTCCQIECAWKCVFGPCPPPNPLAICSRECTADCDCPGGQKCCVQHCRKQCVKPIDDINTGSCPAPRRSCDECFSHSDCRGDLQCCYDGCERKCVPPGRCRTYPPPRCLLPSRECPPRKCDECVRNRQCPRGQKCCFDGCNRKCADRPCFDRPRQIKCDLCITDSDCGRCEKCCSDGCWKKCVQLEKIPPPKPCAECASDCHCPMGQLCCFDGCRMNCLLPYRGKCPHVRPRQCDECCSDTDCKRCHSCIKQGGLRRCVPVPLPMPPPGSCHRCSVDCECGLGMKCCFDGCKRVCKRESGECPQIPKKHDCPECCSHCRPYETCQSVNDQWKCVRGPPPPPTPCDLCSSHRPCGFGMKCCVVGCKRICVWGLGGCPILFPGHNCPDCCHNCQRFEKCTFVDDQWKCVGGPPPPKVCSRCSSDRECSFGMKCCVHGCRRSCMRSHRGECPVFPRGEHCPECCSNCGRFEKCIFTVDQWKCVSASTPPPPPPSCDLCSSDSDCRFRQRCCVVGCQRKCVRRRRGECPLLPPGHTCPECCPNCRHFEKCRFIEDQWKCVPGSMPPVCDLCSSDSQCRFGKKCCAVGCKRTCVRPLLGVCPSFPPEVNCPECCLRKCGGCEKCQFTDNKWTCVPDSKLSKPGSCPNMIILGCPIKCYPPFGCPPGQICCRFSGCPSHTCVVGASCAAVTPIPCCKSDCDCAGDKKCCFNGCANYCTRPRWH